MAYITQTAAFLPGDPVPSDRIADYIGTLDGESDVARKMLALNGIRTRHYAQTSLADPAPQRATHDVYELAAEAAARLGPIGEATFLAAGTTYAPLAAPGIASIVQSRLGGRGLIERPVEISSHAGICTSSSQAIVAAVRAIDTGAHEAAVCIGAEHASDALKASAIRPIDDRAEHDDIRRSQWFMCVFLRFMLSDGAGAMRLDAQPRGDGPNLRVEWTHAASHAHARPLCMQVESRTARLTQDPAILAKHLFPAAEQTLAEALAKYDANLSDYDRVLPHLSSLYFRSRFDRLLDRLADGSPPPYWTNLPAVGNTGAASIYLMLDGYLREVGVRPGDRLLLLVPESGQFNFVVASLRAV